MVNLRSFHMDFGQNPIDATLLVENLVNYKMKANVKGNLNLGELSSMFPMEGTTLRGNYTVDMTADGIYDSINNIIPKISATMRMANGYVKSSELPYALEDLSFDAVVKNESGNMNDLFAVVKDFTMVMDGEPFNANLTFSNLANYTWDLQASGGVDLEKITKVFPLEGMQLAGQIKADLTTKGDMASLEAERYERMPTSGAVSVAGFTYVDETLPYDVTIATANATFDPQKISITQYQGTVGKSDMNITGSVSNYMAYLFSENQVLKGTMNYKGKLLDLNEFMTEEETEEAPTVSTGEETGEVYGVVEVPKNIDFLMKSTIDRVEVMDMSITNAVGDIVVKDGVASFKNVKFNLLEGAFAMNGAYDTRDLDKPTYDFDLDVEGLSIQQSFNTFSLVQSYAPIAQLVNGKVSTDFSVSGLLNEEMMPELSSVTGEGLFKIAQASLTQSKILQGITSLTSLSSNATETATLKDVLMSASIEDGKLKVKPFDINLGEYKTTVSGATSLDGTINYNLKMNVPASKLGSQFSGLVASLTGSSAGEDTMIPLNIGIGGTYNDPKPQLLASEQKQQATAAVKEKAKDEVKSVASDLLDNVKDDNARDLVGSLLGTNKQDSATTAGEAKTDSTQTTDLKKKLEDEAKDKIRSLFKKKKN